MSGDLFSPAGVTFKPISRKYINSQFVVLFIWVAIMLIGCAVAPLASGNPWLWLLEIGPLVLLVWQMWLIPRQVKSWGYAEGEKNLYIRRGIMFKKMWAVPYGRMQFVDVQQGPLDRAFGLARVSLKTASMESNADIPGLPRDEADRIRTVLTERGEALRAGL
ncbi:PH domain-containing protein [Mobiluncus porci]|uniref:PH domain-containing protein n=1 Tax=Mobiluncus porci TaxID=2652278 RepID=A0A7K0K2J4_9ACTO|nr:PH domain-containing protein [Mobiluncus porci]MST49701.1 PH domain-containing protein [Mobiluncus porci]